MNQTTAKSVIDKTIEFVRHQMESDSSGHDWWHIYRVHKLAIRLAQEEGADLVVVELAALLHDIQDWKFTEGDADQAMRKTVGLFLSSLGVAETVIEAVLETIQSVSFKGAGVPSTALSLEAKVVQDADRLDALGAIGIARTFAYGGHKERLMHDPAQKPVLHQTFEQYKAARGTSINHFFEKLLLLKDRLNTESARRLAKERHHFMEQYLEQFFNEWEGLA